MIFFTEIKPQRKTQRVRCAGPSAHPSRFLKGVRRFVGREVVDLDFLAGGAAGVRLKRFATRSFEYENIDGGANGDID